VIAFTPRLATTPFLSKVEVNVYITGADVKDPVEGEDLRVATDGDLGIIGLLGTDGDGVGLVP